MRTGAEVVVADEDVSDWRRALDLFREVLGVSLAVAVRDADGLRGRVDRRFAEVFGQCIKRLTAAARLAVHRDQTLVTRFQKRFDVE